MNARALICFATLLFSGLSAMSEDAPKPQQLPPPKNVRLDKWQVLGMGGGGTTLKPTVSPHDPNVVVLKCDMTGAYITKDGGASWRMFNLRTGIGAFAFDPSNPKVIYAGNVGLWKSEDLGDTWSLIWPDPKKTKEYWRDDHGEYVLESEDGTYQNGSDEWIEEISVFRDPGKDESTVAFVRFGKIRWLGQETLEIFFGALLNVRGVGGGFAVTEQNVVVYGGEIAGTKIFETKGRIAFHDIQSIAKPQYIATHIIDVDEEKRFKRLTRILGLGQDIHPGLTGDATSFEMKDIFGPTARSLVSLGPVTCCQKNPNVVYTSFTGLQLGEGPDNLFNGIAKTEDGGKTWSIVHKESTKPSENLAGSWIEPRMRQGNPNLWFDSARGLAVAPSDPNIVYATDCFRAYKTTDGGKTWAQMNSFRTGNQPRAPRPLVDGLVVDNKSQIDDSSYDGAVSGTWQTRGLDVTNCYGVHWDPFDPQHMYLSQTDMGLFQSYDGGKSWQVSTTGVPDHWKNTTYWVECDPEVKGLMWGAFSYAHDLPRNKMWRGRDTDDYEGGVGVSTDGGLTWTVSSNGMPQTACTHILLDPSSPKDKRVLYACGFGRGVYKSVDSGATWTLKNKGVEQEKPLAWRIVRDTEGRDKEGTLYLIVACRKQKQAIPGPDDGCVYVSRDGAESWTRLPMPKGQNFPTGLAVDPADLKHLYLTTWGAFSMDGDVGGVFESRDGGQTWSHIFKLGPHCYDVTLDPKDPKIMYVCGFNSGAWRSTDAGKTWSRIKGYNFKWGHRVIIDPINPEMIYITTFGGGLWHGPAAGDPDAKEDILTPISPRHPDAAVK